MRDGKVFLYRPSPPPYPRANSMIKLVIFGGGREPCEVNSSIWVPHPLVL